MNLYKAYELNAKDYLSLNLEAIWAFSPGQASFFYNRKRNFLPNEYTVEKIVIPEGVSPVSEFEVGFEVRKEVLLKIEPNGLWVRL